MFRQRFGSTALLAIALISIGFGCRSGAKPAAATMNEGDTDVRIHYLEIVSNDVDAVCRMYERVHGLSFGPPDPDLGNARVAEGPDGALVGIRKPLAAHETPIERTYFAVEDLQRAVKEAEAAGAVVAYPPTRQGKRGSFAIVIQGDVQHGLWQR